MVIARMIAIALMVGLVAAGFAWLGCNLVENLFALATRRRKGAQTDEEAPADKSGR